MNLGWKILESGFDYDIGFQTLSKDEEIMLAELEAKFKEISKFKEIENKEEAEKEIKFLIERVASENKLILEDDQSAYLIKAAISHIYGFMGMDPILKDDSIEEIAVNGINKPVYVYVRNKGWKKTNLVFTKKDVVVNLINKMAREIGRRITYQNPRLNGILPDGSRLHASIPPISNVEITIRKFRQNPFSVFDLIENKTVSAEAMALVWMLMQSDLSILVTGNTASGKTSSLNSIFSFVPMDERVLITEETPEINIPHKHKVNLVANKELGIGISDLVADSLRMRPDRVIVGEVRTSEEVLALIDTILSGQARGCYATFHSQSAFETLSRLRSLGVLEIDLKSIDLVITQRRMLKYDTKKRRTYEIRKIIEIAEVDKTKEMSVRNLFEYDYNKDKWDKKLVKSQLIGKASKSMGITEKEFLKEMKKRQKFLEKNIGKKISFEKSVDIIQKFAFGGGK